MPIYNVNSLTAVFEYWKLTFLTFFKSSNPVLFSLESDFSLFSLNILQLIFLFSGIFRKKSLTWGVSSVFVELEKDNTISEQSDTNLWYP